MLVLDVKEKDLAVVKYLERCGRSDLFKWPALEDMAETNAQFVYRWGFEVNPASSNG